MSISVPSQDENPSIPELAITQFEVTSDMLSKVPQMKRPAHISDREFAETYRALANSIELENAGEPSVTVTWAELKREMGIED